MQASVEQSMIDKVREAREAEGTAEVWLGLAPVLVLQERVEDRPIAYPDPFHVQQSGQEPGTVRWILWEAESYFMVEFRGRTPIRGAPKLHSVETGSNRWAAAAPVRSDAASPTPYKYEIAIIDGGKITAADPMGIVDRDPV